ncbi:hypothetical protein [Stenotrophomonas sp. PS02301]|uniref:hypothetical protein n=1 Tax=Stenotrophomonas sp. PS02301 TaxID=2991427 RepID=UPI00249A3D46|nr:hypothetical protein [Stenotrophomonas sp. PS02301]
MSTTPDTSVFVNAIACDLEEGGFRQVSGTTLRRTLATAVSAALPLLEAGNPVSELAEQQGQVIVHALADAYAAGAEGLQFGGLARMETLAAALAPTGKQQVGEVQGDALREAAMAVLGHIVTDTQPAYDAKQQLVAALAARQPGSFPAGWKLVPELASEEQLRTALDTGVYHDGEDSARAVLADEYRTMVAAAPPAQGIDLGQQRPLIARSLAEWHEDDGNVMWWAWCGRGWAGEPAWCGTPSDSDWPGYHTHWTQHPSQPALIDQRDAAPGVAS